MTFWCYTSQLLDLGSATTCPTAQPPTYILISRDNQMICFLSSYLKEKWADWTSCLPLIFRKNLESQESKPESLHPCFRVWKDIPTSQQYTFHVPHPTPQQLYRSPNARLHILTPRFPLLWC